MTSWDIDPAGVAGVLNRTRSNLDDFIDRTNALITTLDGAARNCGSAIVAQALLDYLHYATPDLEFVVRRTGQAMEAALTATSAYLHGDLEMAANAQHSATASPESDVMPSAPGHVRR